MSAIDKTHIALLKECQNFKLRRAINISLLRSEDPPLLDSLNLFWLNASCLAIQRN